MALRAVKRRPVFIASFGGVPETAATEAKETVEGAEDKPAVRTRLRGNFPAVGERPHGGYSDGYCFSITFSAGRFTASYELVLSFLREEGYGDLPVPRDVEELRRFRLPPRMRHQLSLFGDDGYVHNPIRICFPPPGGRAGALRLEICDETAENHLLRFHRRM